MIWYIAQFGGLRLGPLADSVSAQCTHCHFDYCHYPLESESQAQDFQAPTMKALSSRYVLNEPAAENPNRKLQFDPQAPIKGLGLRV